MAEQVIDCTVRSCYYNDAGERCRAETIQVRNNPAALGNTRMEVGEIGTVEGRQAANSTHTLCNTFIPQSQGPKPGIRRMG